MDLKSGYPFWAVRNGLMHAFPRLEADVACDVLVIGGGITGALIADELATHGNSVVVVEQRDIAWGSTAASTALLQYEIDTHLVDLAKRYGEDDAAMAYRACGESIDMLGEVARGLRDVDFERADSLYYASRRRDVASLREEYDARRRHGFDIEYLESEPLKAEYMIDAPAALRSKQAAQVDPYRFASRLLARLVKRGAQVFDRTAILRLDARPRDVVATTDNGARIRARHVVIAAGYASQHWLPKQVARNRSSYAFVTDPISEAQLGPLTHTLVWETARPYLYMRTTGDRRLLIGGEDDDVDVPARRDARVEKKARVLMKQIAKIRPDLDLTPTFSWAGTFAETEDGLPFFGPHAATGKRVHFAMAYGGNGITYSMLGAGLLRALIERRKHPLAALFSFDRLDR
ncbi:FAD-binding oxidoreductase [Luteimonas fraxinea]|uniref:FAD-binding oxidoreductase n=1 Tax=Luteimonas fraxinea TaxID=2901869 RepID=A0ABS8UAP4_9GAMM|nr:FAD-dependent oxidoreductase [Luteimonas fraxinea]MCD9095718.1 FAD-binding oxidoreductase [Luteimonas fraxinea]MCD9124299.1 FAD-binding oxidoreductase [Luteimonas fraxinea]UHH11094.1 FAD-binding oxidoreductase [Luteimonas fraxinea]